MQIGHEVQLMELSVKMIDNEDFPTLEWPQDRCWAGLGCAIAIDIDNNNHERSISKSHHAALFTKFGVDLNPWKVCAKNEVGIIDTQDTFIMGFGFHLLLLFDKGLSKFWLIAYDMLVVCQSLKTTQLGWQIQ
jgi:hypothetical protein